MTQKKKQRDEINSNYYIRINDFFGRESEIARKCVKMRKIKNIIEDGFGFNYGVKSDLSKESRNNHILYRYETKIKLKKVAMDLIVEA